MSDTRPTPAGPDAPAPRPSSFGGMPPTLQAAILATVAMVVFSVVPPSVRLLSDTMSPWQIVFIRTFFGAVGIGLFLCWSGLYELKTRQTGIHFIRSTFNFVGMVMWFWALGQIELAKGIAIHFTMPLFITLFAMIFLRERVGPRRLGAMLAGPFGIPCLVEPARYASFFSALCGHYSCLLTRARPAEKSLP